MTLLTEAGAIALRWLNGAILFALSGLACIAQTKEAPIADEIWRAGAYGGASWLNYAADMKGLPGVPSCCPRYENGSGNGLAFGVAGEARFLPGLSGGIRLLFATYDGALEADEYELVTAEQDTVTAIFHHTIEASQPAIAIEAIVAYDAIPSLGVIAGARADLMMGGTFHQREEIFSPANIRFENDSRQRLVFDGDIPQETSVHLALFAGLRYDFPMNGSRTLLLSPEVQVWQGLSDLVDGEAWTMQGIRAGLALSFVGRAAVEATPLEPAKKPEPTPAPAGNAGPKSNSNGNDDNR